MATHKQSEEIQLQIVKATDDLLYQKGYNLMSFSDIAMASGIPRGNLNYHFKTKQQVLEAVIAYRIEQMKAMLQDWDNTIHSPLDRLKRFVQIPIYELESITKLGCPMGSLNTELGKVQGGLQSISCQQFDVFREWLNQQFQLLVSSQDLDPDELTLHLLVQTQGLAVLAHVYNDPQVVKREVSSIVIWLEDLAKSSNDLNSKSYN